MYIYHPIQMWDLSQVTNAQNTGFDIQISQNIIYI